MKKLLFASVLLSLFSCDKSLIGEHEPNTQSNNFELFWDDFDQHYSLFDVRNTDWDELKAIYRPQVYDTISDGDLWTILSNLIEHLDDSHTVLYDGNGQSYRSGYALNAQSKYEISQELIRSAYVDVIAEVSSEDDLTYGKIKDKNIGYIYLGTMDGRNPAVIDAILDELTGFKAIILDIRQNTGGDDRYAARIAQGFSDGVHFIYTVQTRNGIRHDNFDEKKSYFTPTKHPNSYLKPVIVLTDRATISAGEVFMLHMKSFAQVVQLGDTTAGDFSTVSNMRFLPNSWHYRYSIQKFLLPNGTSLDGIGHAPDLFVKNTKEDIDARNDKVLEKAIQYLFDAYTID